MLPHETWRVAVEALWSNKLRAILTTLGVIIGSACIVLVVTVALTGRRYVIGLIEGVGANLVYANYEVNPQQAVVRSDEITLADMEAVKNTLPNVVTVAATSKPLLRNVVIGGTEHAVTLFGATDGFQVVRNLLILRGRFLDPIDQQTHSKVCLITDELASLVFPNEDPIGNSLRVGQISFTVVGVFRERVGTFGLSEVQRYTVVVPFSLMQYFTGDDAVEILYAQADAPEDVALVTTQVGDLLRNRHSRTATYVVQNLSEILNVARKIGTALTVVLLVIGFIALMVSGIGIMNIMLVTVTERTREIGIRKAIGARRQEILLQFLIEALLISGIGSLLGVLIALAIPVIVRPFLPGNLRVPVPWLSVVVAFVVACSTGLFFGYLPADKAARLQPTESLRYE
ncbi:MAG TPA: ABC transporter permease [Candidatus Acidoferrales bacterium]|jgi:putative ABC transport system permease protein|nr:ABC transporter permease [Candidatus Acidoferrales bacterium]